MTKISSLQVFPVFPVVSLFFLLIFLLIFSGCSFEKSSENISTALSTVNAEISETIMEVHKEEDDTPSQLKKLVEQEQKNNLKKNVEIVLERVIPTNRISEISDKKSEKVLVNVVLKNPDHQEIQSVQAWFLYPPQILKGEKITLRQKDIFPIVAPNEKKFERDQGIVKLGFSVEGKGKSTDSEIILAQVEFSKVEENSKTPFQFEPFSGHIKVMTFTKNGLRNILK